MMRRCRLFGPVGRIALAAAVLAVPASAGKFMRVNSPEDVIRMWNMEKADGGIYVGKILEREVHSVDLQGLGPVDVTSLKIQVSDKVTLRHDGDVIRAVYLGGSGDGSEYRTSAQPADEVTEVGIEAVFMLLENPYPGQLRDALWISGLNAVFPVTLSASGHRVAHGKYDGMAIHGSVRVEDFLETHRQALSKVIAEVESSRRPK